MAGGSNFGGVGKYIPPKPEPAAPPPPKQAPPPPPPPPQAPPPPPPAPVPIPELPAAPEAQMVFAPPTAPGKGWQEMGGLDSLNPRLGTRLPRPMSISALIETGGY